MRDQNQGRFAPQREQAPSPQMIYIASGYQVSTAPTANVSVSSFCALVS